MIRYDYKYSNGMIDRRRSDGYGQNVVDVAMYGSLTELTNALLGSGADYTNYGGWAGSGNMQTACDTLLRGVSEAETKQAKELINKINAKVENRQRFERIPSVYGSSVRIGAFLRGEPNDMMRRKRMISDVAPVKIVIENTVAGGISHHEMMMRGSACAALVQALSNIRPTEMWVSWGLGGDRHSTIGMAKVSTTPANLAQLVAALATANSARKIAFAEIQQLRGHQYGGWAIGYPDGKARNEEYRKAIRLKEQDIFIAGGTLREGRMMERDPVAWVNKYLDAQR